MPGWADMRWAVARGPKPASIRKVPQGARMTVELPPEPLPRTQSSRDIRVSKVPRVRRERGSVQKPNGSAQPDEGVKLPVISVVAGVLVDLSGFLTDKYQVIETRAR